MYAVCESIGKGIVGRSYKYTTVYTLNQIPVTGEDKTPYEKWFKKKPSIKHLRVFGTTCYAFIPKQFRNKWEPKLRKGKLVDYTDIDKNFRNWDEKRRRIDICKDVKFDDTSELSNATTSISLDMPNKKDQPRDSEPLVREEFDEGHSSKDGKDNEKIQSRKARQPIGSKNKTYEKNQRELRDRLRLNAPKRYNEQYFLVSSAPLNYVEAVNSEDSKH